MRSNTLIPVAQYVRMSTEDQQYSIDNQKSAIAEYAARHGFEVVETYADAGKSGVAIRNRAGLGRLLLDVVSGNPMYRAILVYDISRWGRFQDCDEAAHYEFLCKSAGIPVHYCAEPFENDGTPSSSIFKALKRLMAGEYSRELGVKVTEGKNRLAQLGFRMGGAPGLGLRRLAISADGKRRLKLESGQYKNLVTDHVILIPGPRREVECLRQIFKLASKGVGFTKIADLLNQQGLTTVSGKAWEYNYIYQIVRNPKYVGCNIWNRTTQKLRTKAKRVPQELWLVKPGAFSPLVDQSTFDRVQGVIKKRASRLSSEQLVQKVKHLLAVKGKLTGDIIDGARGMPTVSTLAKRFGSLMRTYQLMGYQPPRSIFKDAYHIMRARRMRKELIDELQTRFPGHVTAFKASRVRRMLSVDKKFSVSLLAGVPIRTETGKLRWLIHVIPKERDYVTLVYTFKEKYNGFERLYVLPCVDKSVQKFKRLDNVDPFLGKGQRLNDLSEFYDVASRLEEARHSIEPLNVS